MYIYIYMCVCVCVFVCIYVCVSKTEHFSKASSMNDCTCFKLGKIESNFSEQFFRAHLSGCFNFSMI